MLENTYAASWIRWLNNWLIVSQWDVKTAQCCTLPCQIFSHKAFPASFKAAARALLLAHHRLRNCDSPMTPHAPEEALTPGRVGIAGREQAKAGRAQSHAQALGRTEADTEWERKACGFH